ncbi:MAG: hypothetical protein ACIALR_06415, partial [Blastopirellula sp. JB062]
QVSADAPRINSEGAFLLAMMPHMHLRGKSFRYELKGKDENQILLDVPAYDFNWQTAYRLKDPLPLAAGSVIHCVAQFDNSKWNIANPDPTETVRWGDQTWEEMMIGYFDVAHPYVAQEEKEEVPVDRTIAAARKLMEKYDVNGDGVVVRDEVPNKGKQYFDLIDKDGDKKVSEKDLVTLLQKMPALLSLLK